MVNLIIFGTRAISDIILDYYLDESKACVLAFVNSIDNSEKVKRGYRVITLTEIDEYDYDYVLIAAGAFDIIFEQCTNSGVPSEKIIGITQQASNRLKEIFDRTNSDISKIFNINETTKFFKRDLPEFHIFSYYMANEIFLNSFNVIDVPNTIDSVRIHHFVRFIKRNHNKQCHRKCC